MARALWSGSLSFGLVNVPVQQFSAGAGPVYVAVVPGSLEASLDGAGR